MNAEQEIREVAKKYEEEGYTITLHPQGDGVPPFAAGHLESGCVYAWAGLEAAMRRLANEAELYGRSTPTELLATLYSNGFLSREEFDRLRNSLRVRTQVVHGLVTPKIDLMMVQYVI